MSVEKRKSAAVKMFFGTLKVTTLLSIIPSTLACLGYEGGLPVPTSTKTNSAVIVVPAGTTFDGGWAKYDRGSGACNEQAEGGEAKFSLSRVPTLPTIFSVADLEFICRRCGRRVSPEVWCHLEERYHWQEPGRGCTLRRTLHARICVVRGCLRGCHHRRKKATYPPNLRSIG